jgi:hypothetical protein
MEQVGIQPLTLNLEISQNRPPPRREPFSGLVAGTQD